MTRKWAGVKLVAVGPLKWTCRGELVAFEPGDIFELDERDLAVPGVDPDFWLKVGAVEIYHEPKAKSDAKSDAAKGAAGD